MSAPQVDIPTFYKGKCVFLTGGTGFVGKTIVEKLLRSCPEIDTIYLLVRGKGGVNPNDRLKALFDSDLFESVRAICPNYAEKVVAVEGELTEENMKLSPEDLELLCRRVTVIFHVAATIKFREKLKLAVELNIVSVLRIIELAKKLNKCEAVLHVSTAFAHTNQAVCEEKVYKPEFDPLKLVAVMKELNVEMAEQLCPYYTKGHPNTYTFTKSCAEYLFATEGKGLPRAIFRPSIISCCFKEPIAGWVDNYNGVVGISSAIGAGVIRVMPGDTSVTADVVPVDMVANYAIATVWHVGKGSIADFESDNIPVYNCNSSTQNRATWGDYETGLVESFKSYPLETRGFRRPRMTMYPVVSWDYKLRVFVYHTLPGMMYDALLMIQGKKPRMQRTFSKISAVCDEYQFFTTTDLKWENKNAYKLVASMTEGDRALFNFDFGAIDWRKYIDLTCYSVKKFLFKEDMNRMKQARKERRKMALRGVFLRFLLILIFGKIFFPLLQKRGISGAWLLLIPTIYLARRT